MQDLRDKNFFFRSRKYHEKLADARRILNRRQYAQKKTLFEKVEPEDFEQVKIILDDLQSKGIIGEWAIGGGAAVTYYTLAIPSIDIDVFSTYAGSSLLMPFGDLYPYLIKTYGAVAEGDMLRIKGLYLQFLPAESSNPVDAEAVKDPRILEDGMRIFKLEYLICSMLYLRSPKYQARLLHLKVEHQYDEQELRKLLQKFGLEERWDRIVVE